MVPDTCTLTSTIRTGSSVPAARTWRVTGPSVAAAVATRIGSLRRVRAKTDDAEHDHGTEAARIRVRMPPCSARSAPSGTSSVFAGGFRLGRGEGEAG